MKYILVALIAGAAAGASNAYLAQNPNLLQRAYWIDLATKPPCNNQFRTNATLYDLAGAAGHDYVLHQAEAAGCRL